MGATFAADGSQSLPSTNALDAACAKQAKAMGLASIMIIGNEAAPKGKKYHYQGKDKKMAGVALHLRGQMQSLICP